MFPFLKPLNHSKFLFLPLRTNQHILLTFNSQQIFLYAHPFSLLSQLPQPWLGLVFLISNPQTVYSFIYSTKMYGAPAQLASDCAEQWITCIIFLQSQSLESFSHYYTDQQYTAARHRFKIQIQLCPTFPENHLMSQYLEYELQTLLRWR